MSKTGVIMRLIDIALNLIFGFLIISEIDKNSQIRLPHSNVETKRLQYQEELLVIGIKNKSVYLIEAENIELNSISAVLNKIERRKQSLEKLERQLRVRIRSEWNLPIKYTMRIANYCRSKNIPVGMDVHSVNARR